MTTLLHIASSSRLTDSVTRQIGRFTVGELAKTHPGARIIERDLLAPSIPHLTPELVAAFWQPGSPLLALSEQLIEEIIAADILVIEVPMYNFSLPSVLKAWIDHIVRAGRTFTYEGGAPKGLVKGKKAILVLGRGGVYSEGPAKVMDHQEPYLRTILGFIGITEVETIYIEGTAMGPEKTAAALSSAKASATQFAKAA